VTGEDHHRRQRRGSVTVPTRLRQTLRPPLEAWIAAGASAPHKFGLSILVLCFPLLEKVRLREIALSWETRPTLSFPCGTSHAERRDVLSWHSFNQIAEML
jgi:hypothetical protein